MGDHLGRPIDDLELAGGGDGRGGGRERTEGRQDGDAGTGPERLGGGLVRALLRGAGAGGGGAGAGVVLRLTDLAVGAGDLRDLAGAVGTLRLTRVTELPAEEGDEDNDDPEQQQQQQLQEDRRQHPQEGEGTGARTRTGRGRGRRGRPPMAPPGERVPAAAAEEDGGMSPAEPVLQSEFELEESSSDDNRTPSASPPSSPSAFPSASAAVVPVSASGSEAGWPDRPAAPTLADLEEEVYRKTLEMCASSDATSDGEGGGEALAERAMAAARGLALVHDARRRMALMEDGTPVQPHDDVRNLWEKMKWTGWRRVRGSGLEDSLYVLPGGRTRAAGGVGGVDYLRSERDVRRFAAQHFGWRGTVAVVDGGEGVSGGGGRRRRKRGGAEEGGDGGRGRGGCRRLRVL